MAYSAPWVNATPDGSASCLYCVGLNLSAPLLIEDIGEMLDPGLEPVLQKAVFINGPRSLPQPLYGFQ